MPAPPLSTADIANRKRALFQARQEAPKRQFARAAELLGIHRSTLKRWLDKERAAIGRPAVVPSRGLEPRFSDSKSDVLPLDEEGEIIRVMAIGDPHDKPGRDKRRFTWMGRHAAETRPDHIVCIGDWASLDSLSTHEMPGSQNDAERPPFHEEIESLDESASLFVGELGISAIPIHQTMGNHEHRAVRAANRQPKQCGDLPIRLEQVFSRYNIRTYPFGEFVDIGGVDFVHVPLSIMGKEMGGELVLRNVGLKSLKSVVFGHVHRYGNLPVPKVGQQRAIRIISLPTSLPYGTIEKYNGMSTTGWDYGIVDLHIRDGVILSSKHAGMHELEQAYGD